MTLTGAGSFLHNAGWSADGNTLLVGWPGLAWHAPSWRAIEAATTAPSPEWLLEPPRVPHRPPSHPRRPNPSARSPAPLRPVPFHFHPVHPHRALLTRGHTLTPAATAVGPHQHRNLIVHFQNFRFADPHTPAAAVAQVFGHDRNPFQISHSHGALAALPPLVHSPLAIRRYLAGIRIRSGSDRV